MLQAKHITVRYGSLTIVDDVGFTLEDGAWLMIVGPNGAGKSTLLGALSQGVPYTGSVLLDGTDARSLRPAALAREIGMLAQTHSVGYGFSVDEVVRLGRYAYAGGLIRSASDADERAVERALRLTGMEAFRDHSVLTLSGGEVQRTFLAQLFAQDARRFLLDEPTNHLDLAYQQQIFELIRGWIAETGRSVVSVVHDLSLARAYGTHALLMDRGRVVAQGEMQSVLTPAHLKTVFGLDVYAYMRRMLRQWE